MYNLGRRRCQLTCGVSVTKRLMDNAHGFEIHPCHFWLLSGGVVALDYRNFLKQLLQTLNFEPR